MTQTDDTQEAQRSNVTSLESSLIALPSSSDDPGGCGAIFFVVTFLPSSVARSTTPADT